MDTTADLVFLTGLDQLSAVVERVPADGWDAPSPCAGWTARDVLGHIGTAVSMGVAILNGEPPVRPDVERPADVLGPDPVAYWRGLADSARGVVTGIDLDVVIETSFGSRSVRDGLAFPAIDLWVHSWDIAHATGSSVELPLDVIAFAHTFLDPLPTEQMRGEGRPFGPEIVDADAGPTEAFIAWTGRRTG